MEPQGGAAVDFAYAYQFQLSYVPNSAEFTALFDAYRINKVVVKFMPTGTQVLVNSASNPEEAPICHAVIDYNDANAPTSADELRQYANVRTFPINKPQTFVFRPRTATPVYRDGLSAAYLQNSPRLFIDCSYADVPHYGMKVWVQGGNTVQVYRTRIEVIYYFSFKNTK